MTTTELLSVLAEFRDGSCPSEIAVDAVKMAGAWPFVWQVHSGGFDTLVRVEDGQGFYRLQNLGEGRSWRLESLGPGGFARQMRSIIVGGDVYGPRSDLRHLAEAAALRCVLDRMVSELTDGCPPGVFDEIPF